MKIRERLFILLFGAEWRELLRLREEVRSVTFKNTVLEMKVESERPRPARFRLDGGMSEEAIALALAGSAGLPVMRAVQAHVAARIVAVSDLATDIPREATGGIPGYTEAMRLHDAGGAHYLAELLAKLQELSAPQSETTEARG